MNSEVTLARGLLRMDPLKHDLYQNWLGIGYRQEDLPKAMDNRNGEKKRRKERVKGLPTWQNDELNVDKVSFKKRLIYKNVLKG